MEFWPESECNGRARAERLPRTGESGRAGRRRHPGPADRRAEGRRRHASPGRCNETGRGCSFFCRGQARFEQMPYAVLDQPGEAYLDQAEPRDAALRERWDFRFSSPLGHVYPDDQLAVRIPSGQGEKGDHGTPLCSWRNGDGRGEVHLAEDHTTPEAVRTFAEAKRRHFEESALAGRPGRALVPASDSRCRFLAAPTGGRSSCTPRQVRPGHRFQKRHLTRPDLRSVQRREGRSARTSSSTGL